MRKQKKEISQFMWISKKIKFFGIIEDGQRKYLKNLLENAVKYANPGTKIMILQETYETYTEIHVKDEGKGIPKEEWNRIFQRFYRGKGTEDIEGSGIGLYLSRLNFRDGTRCIDSRIRSWKWSVYCILTKL